MNRLTEGALHNHKRTSIGMLRSGPIFADKIEAFLQHIMRSDVGASVLFGSRRLLKGRIQRV